MKEKKTQQASVALASLQLSSDPFAKEFVIYFVDLKMALINNRTISTELFLETHKRLGAPLLASRSGTGKVSK